MFLELKPILLAFSADITNLRRKENPTNSNKPTKQKI